ncbi:flagellar export protein FliJ [Halobacillus sp. ACCC02827]|uniref:flagellar export protein FliJ n=1 Tax=Bacillaceae TaxID=186817 RepID=UPI0002A501B9|nr:MULTISPECIES: flagellar export protein FliJ [Bacillaceae]ELK44742.1 flagellar biosynthesis chaperone [Halobacillus sp. BAB-2008]QHT46657.1 flagellar export protein FliJ [Bacillus sp. SB49]WJE17468.1 flagellar export protein FliJ [Halobacillus sp. ACCC02827]
MTTIHTFEKIRDLQDRDKKEKQRTHEKAVDQFEEHAYRLYEALKKKEDAIQAFNSTMEKRAIQAHAFLQHQQYIARLEEIIHSLQPLVQQARRKMDRTQTKLTEAYREVKKYERLIENKEEKQKQYAKQEENKNMDEVSMVQYLNRRNR